MFIQNKLIEIAVSDSLITRYAQDQSYDAYIRDDGKAKLPLNLHIFYSHYEYSNYEGYGFLVGYDTEQKSFFYNTGSHCSCNGLEGQWDIEYYTYEELVGYIERIVKNNRSDAKAEYKELLDLLTTGGV